MASGDPISDQQVSFIDSLARDAIVDYEGEATLDDYVRPVYGCGFYALNRGQASMLIDDLKHRLGIEGVPAELGYASIFDAVDGA